MSEREQKLGDVIASATGFGVKNNKTVNVPKKDSAERVLSGIGSAADQPLRGFSGEAEEAFASGTEARMAPVTAAPGPQRT